MDRRPVGSARIIRGNALALRKIRTGPSRLYPGLTVLHAAKGGGPVLREQGSWRTVNGFMWSTSRGTWAWTFRRNWAKEATR